MDKLKEILNSLIWWERCGRAGNFIHTCSLPEVDEKKAAIQALFSEKEKELKAMKTKKLLNNRKCSCCGDGKNYKALCTNPKCPNGNYAT